MPQNNYLTMFQASYPLLAPPQKPGGVTVLTTATAPRVPNKHTYASGSIQSYDISLGQMVLDRVVDKLQERVAEAREEEAGVVEETEEEEVEEEDEEEPPHPTRPTRSRRGR